MFEQNYFESKMKSNQLRNSFDAGYESLLSQNSFLSNRTDSSLYSAPSTPVKSNSFIINCNNSSTSPDFKQQYIADVNGIYYASIRLNNEPFLSPIKNQINSPIKSPKFVLNTEQFIQQRDNLTSKLLRSPAFKPNNIISPTHGDTPCFIKPEIKSFSSRFKSNYPCFDTPDRFIRPSPTEEEFMELLIRNKHLPKNPENLIGRNMGLDYFDILTELSNKSMYNVLDTILGFMDNHDLVRTASVSRSWRGIVKQNKNLNRQRVEYLKNKKYIFEKFKENRPFTPREEVNKSRLNLEQKRRLLKDYRHKNSLDLKENEASGLVKNENGIYVFASLDLNCLNNITSGACRYEDFDFSSNRKKSRDEDEEMIIESPSKKSKPNNLNEELFNACNSLFDCINKSQNVTQRPGILEREFKDISLDEKINPVVMESSPMVRRSPLKRHIDSTTRTNQNLICSKKSKKNLKRL